MSRIIAGPISNEDAAKAIRGKPVVIREVFDTLLPELKARSFTVSGVEDANVLQRLRDRIADLPRGGDWDAIKRDLVNELSPFMVDADADEEKRDAQIQGAARRAELLLRTHGFQAYQATQYRNLTATKKYLPYWKYVTVGDDKVRNSHAKLNGLILSADHPFWNDHFPPWDWGCRCQVVSVTERAYRAALENPTANAWTMGDEAMKRLEDGTLDRGDGRPVDVSPPSVKAGRQGQDPDKAYSWRPGDLYIPLDQLASRYDDKTWAAAKALFEKGRTGVRVQVSTKTAEQKKTKKAKSELSRPVTAGDGENTQRPVQIVKRDDAIDRLRAAGVTEVIIPKDEIVPTDTMKRLEASIRLVKASGSPIHPRLTFDGMTARDLSKISYGRPAMVYNPETDVIYVDSLAFATITDIDIVTSYNNGRISSPSQHYHYLHEMAHPLHWKRDRKSYGMGLTEEQQRLAVQYVSRYARHNAAEFVAEVFAALRSGRLFERDASVVLDIYNQLGGPL